MSVAWQKIIKQDDFDRTVLQLVVLLSAFIVNSIMHFIGKSTQPAFICSKLTIETLEQGSGVFIVNFEYVIAGWLYLSETRV